MIEGYPGEFVPLHRSYVEAINRRIEQMIKAIREVAPEQADQIEYLFRERMIAMDAA